MPKSVKRYCADADLYLNLSGGSWFWRDEYARIPRSAFIDSDPAFTQLAIAKAEPWYVDFFQRFDHLFTFGSNIGTAACTIPVGDFIWHKTWQPVTLDDWRPAVAAGPSFTTVMTWQIESFADVGGNKDQEFVKYIDLPSRTAQPFELAINGPQVLLREHGWSTLPAMDVSRTPAEYRDFIQRSAGRIRRRQTHLRVEPIGLVQRPHGVLPGVGPSGAGAGHRLDALTFPPAKACWRSRRPTKRWPASTASTATTPSRAACRRDRARVFRRPARAAAAPRRGVCG